MPNAVPHRRTRYPGPVDVSVTTTTLLTGLTSYWKMDEVANARNDSCGTRHLGPVGTVSAVAGKIGNAAGFSSGSHYLVVGGTPIAASSVRSLSLWVYPTSVAGQQSFCEVGNSNADGTPLFILLHQRGGGSGPFAIYHAGGYRDGTTVASANTWYHVVYMYTGTNAQLWINGSQELNSVLGDSGNTAGLFFGNTFSVYNGRIDEVGLWSRALTSTEIAQLYNGGNGVTYPYFI